MSQRLLVGVGIAAVALLILVMGALFTVHQSQQALVLQLGNPVRVVREPGLSFKLPLIQQVEYFEKRVLDFDAPSVELVLGDQKRLVVDAFTRYRISNPLLFRQSAGSELAFRTRLEPIIFSSLRSVLGEVSLFQILSTDRHELMERIRAEANRALARFGVDVVDVRIKRADLPAENSQAIFRRMQTERDREAKELRAQGAEVGQRIRARADRERRVIIAEAQRQSEVLRGEGDGEAIRIFAESFGQDVSFYNFYRSMQAYRQALSDGSTSFVLTPESEFFRYFDRPDGTVASAGGAKAGAPTASGTPAPSASGTPSPSAPGAAVTPPGGDRSGLVAGPANGAEAPRPD